MTAVPQSASQKMASIILVCGFSMLRFLDYETLSSQDFWPKIQIWLPPILFFFPRGAILATTVKILTPQTLQVQAEFTFTSPLTSLDLEGCYFAQAYMVSASMSVLQAVKGWFIIVYIIFLKKTLKNQGVFQNQGKNKSHQFLQLMLVLH